MTSWMDLLLSQEFTTRTLYLPESTRADNHPHLLRSTNPITLLHNRRHPILIIHLNADILWKGAKVKHRKSRPDNPSSGS